MAELKEERVIKTFQIEKSTFNEIQDLAKKENRSTNNMIKVLLLLALEVKKSEN